MIRGIYILVLLVLSTELQSHNCTSQLSIQWRGTLNPYTIKQNGYLLNTRDGYNSFKMKCAYF